MLLNVDFYTAWCFNLTIFHLIACPCLNCYIKPINHKLLLDGVLTTLHATLKLSIYPYFVIKNAICLLCLVAYSNALQSRCLLVPSAGNFRKQFEPRSGPTKCRAWSGSKLFDTLMVFLKISFEKNQQTTKKHAKLPSRQRVYSAPTQYDKDGCFMSSSLLMKGSHLCDPYMNITGMCWSNYSIIVKIRGCHMTSPGQCISQLSPSQMLLNWP